MNILCIFLFFITTGYLCPAGYFFAIFRAVGTAGPQLPTFEWARLNLNHKVLNTVGTAGPQPGTFRAQWTPLDLNLEPSELNGKYQNICQKNYQNIYQINNQNIY